MNNFLLKAWFGALFSVITSLFPAGLSPEKGAHPAVPIQVIQVVHPAVLSQVRVHHHIKKTHKMRKPLLAKNSNATPHYLCHFEGNAILEGRPYANASIVVWISSPRIEEMRRTRTGSDGSYSLSFAMDGSSNEPIDWEIRGQTSDLKTVQLAGRQILLPGIQKITVENSLNFIAE